MPRYNAAMETTRPFWWQRTPVIIALIAAAALLVYGQSLGNQFLQWDDDLLITGNPIVTSHFPATVAKAFTSYDPELYIPLTFLSFQIEHAIVGIQPLLYHADNLLLHILCASLVFFLLQRLGISRMASSAGALLFAVHAVNVETVAWVSARKDLLATTFSLLSLLAYLFWKERKMQRWFWASLVLFALALLSKISAITLPLLLLLIEWKEGNLVGKKQATHMAPFVLLSMVFGIIGVLGKTHNITSLSVAATLLLSIKSAVLSLLLFLFPYRLSALYLQASPPTLGDATFFGSALVLVIVGVMTALTARRSKTFAFGMLFFAFALLPSFASFVKNGDVYVTADHYLYFSGIGLLYLACAALDWARPRVGRDIFVATPVALLLLGAAVAAHARSAVWHDSETLFRDTIAKNPRSASMHYNLGLLEQARGDINDALAEYRIVLGIDPAYPKAHVNLGVIAEKTGDRQRALDEYMLALAADPRNPEAHNNIGLLFLAAGRTDDAIAQFQAAIGAAPDFTQAHINLGYVYGKKGMYQEGLREFQTAFALNPGSEKDAEQLKAAIEKLQKQ